MAASIALVLLMGWGVAKALASSDAVTQLVEEKIQQESGLLVDVHAVTPGLGGVELHGLRLVHEARGIEFWADVARIDADVETLRHPEGKELPVYFQGVRITLPDQRVVSSRRMTATRRADGRFASKGHGVIEGSEATIDWNVVMDGEFAEPRGRVQFSRLPADLLDDYVTALPASLVLDRARLDGDLSFEPGVAGDELALTGILAIDGLMVESERLSEQPLRDLALRFDGAGTVSPGSRTVTFDRTVMTLGGAEILLQGGVSAADGELRADLVLELPETACDRAFAAIPAALLGEYQDFELVGAIAGRLELALDTRDPDAARFDVQIDDQCAFREVPKQASLARFRRPFSLRVFDAEGTPMLFETGPGTHAWVDLEHVSPFLVQAVMAHEDATFPDHHGFAVLAIENSLQANLRAGSVVRGASTISMQLAKNLFLDRDRTLDRKAREAVLTWWLERSLGKREIMELYLNVIEFGPDLYGLRPAARHYFRVEPHELTPAQSVFLATLLPSPVKRHRQFERRRLTPGTEEEIRFLLHHMHRKGRIQRAALDYGLWELRRDDFFDPSWLDEMFGPGRPDSPDSTRLASLRAGDDAGEAQAERLDSR